MTASEDILVAESDGVATITLNRPERRNALDLSAMRDLANRVDQLTHTDSVRCVVIRGEGAGFCAGADLPDGRFAERDENVEMMAAVSRVIGGLARATVPVIAEVQGAAVGVGASLALACDLVMVSRTAYFLLPFTGLGLVPDGGATLTVAASVGRARAMYLTLLRERLGASDAFDAGLVSAVCEPADLRTCVGTAAQQLAKGPQQAISRSKQLINGHTLADLDTALARETSEQLPLLDSWEYREGVAAFRERRPADFKPTTGSGMRPTPGEKDAMLSRHQDNEGEAS